jgi:hypothetical protein
MPNVLNQFWQRTDRSVVVDKLKKTLTIPSFGSLVCGKAHGSIFFDFNSWNQIAPSFSKASLDSITATLTAEIWFKPIRIGQTSGATHQLLKANKTSDVSDCIGIQFYDYPADGTKDGAIQAFIVNSGSTKYTALSAVNLIRWNEWQCISITFDSVGLLLSVYLDGVLIATHATTGTISGASKLFGVGSAVNTSTEADSLFVGYIGDVRIWNQVLTSEEVLQRYNKPRGVDGVIDANLRAYFRFTELSGLTITSAVGNAITATLTNPYQTWSTTQKAPIIFGASFIVASYHVSIEQDFSFRFPVSKPTTDCNFELHVSWTDRHGDFQRRKFWQVEGVDIAPSVAVYGGERIESDFTLEIFQRRWQRNCRSNFRLGFEHIIQDSTNHIKKILHL